MSEARISMARKEQTKTQIGRIKKVEKSTKKPAKISKKAKKVVKEEKQAKPQNKIRENLIDLLRGVAVLVMIITHVVAIAFNHEGSRVIYYIGLVGGIASFTTFLF